MTPMMGWKSEFIVACTAYSPMPGQSNTDSISTVPPSIQPKRRPIMARVGSMALRKAYLAITRHGATPCARAATM
ncbi:hypothetical protein D3C78_1910210 [compost metagenome]